ncbi:hypothetical protein NQT62_08145 [Limnobacter humi]|uniref:Uncharacterized protein n=1 Tax=Limnobacter humi TaxID=1778671 RepID=A0ABT1WG94_9BURK|nr:hypothetical protein [Limnobacter humi]MCQ8896399.1 hypothetical protein [Limnobacter humi]
MNSAQPHINMALMPGAAGFVHQFQTVDHGGLLTNKGQGQSSTAWG